MTTAQYVGAYVDDRDKTREFLLNRSERMHSTSSASHYSADRSGSQNMPRYFAPTVLRALLPAAAASMALSRETAVAFHSIDFPGATATTALDISATGEIVGLYDLVLHALFTQSSDAIDDENPKRALS